MSSNFVYKTKSMLPPDIKWSPPKRIVLYVCPQCLHCSLIVVYLNVLNFCPGTSTGMSYNNVDGTEKASCHDVTDVGSDPLTWALRGFLS